MAEDIPTVLAHYWQQLGHTHDPTNPADAEAANAITKSAKTNSKPSINSSPPCRAYPQPSPHLNSYPGPYHPEQRSTVIHIRIHLLLNTSLLGWRNRAA